MKLLKFFLFVIVFLNFVSIGECREIVFVINSGQSMSESDPFRTIAEGVTWSVENLSDKDEVAIVTFNDTVEVIRPLTKINDFPNKSFNLDYYGSSDAGAGILTAIDMLTPKFNMQRDIIFITNGEFQSPQSAKNFQAGLEQAKWLGFNVYLLDMRYNVDPQGYRQYDGYAKFLPINYLEFMTTLRTILQGDFRTAHIELPTNNLTTGTLNFNVPIQARRLKICLLSSNVGNAILKNVNPAIQGSFINIFEIDSPSRNNFEFELNYPQGTGLTLDVIPTVEGTLQTAISPKFLINDILEITPINADKKILADKFFDGKLINVLVNRKNLVGKIENGTIQVDINDLDENISLEKIHFEDVGIIFEGDDTAQLVVQKKNYLAGLIALVGLSIILGLAWLIHNKGKSAAVENLVSTLGEHNAKIIPPVEDFKANIQNSKFSYSGKLMIYFTRTHEDNDTALREFNLFRMNSAQIPLSYVLKQCNIEENFQGAENILINPDKKSILIENKSECTITKRHNLVEKDQTVALYYNDSINISTLDDTAELIMIYKSLKPA